MILGRYHEAGAEKQAALVQQIDKRLGCLNGGHKGLIWSHPTDLTSGTRCCNPQRLSTRAGSLRQEPFSVEYRIQPFN